MTAGGVMAGGKQVVGSLVVTRLPDGAMEAAVLLAIVLPGHPGGDLGRSRVDQSAQAVEVAVGNIANRLPHAHRLKSGANLVQIPYVFRAKGFDHHSALRHADE